MSDRSLTVKLGEETVAALEKLARETGRPRDQLAKEALTRYVDYETWKAGKIRHAMGRADADDFATDEEMEAAFDRYRPAAGAE